jgi:hypothetical protein
MSKAMIGLGGNVLKRLGDGLTAPFQVFRRAGK